MLIIQAVNLTTFLSCKGNRETWTLLQNWCAELGICVLIVRTCFAELVLPFLYPHLFDSVSMSCLQWGCYKTDLVGTISNSFTWLTCLFATIHLRRKWIEQFVMTWISILVCMHIYMVSVVKILLWSRWNFSLVLFQHLICLFNPS